MEKLKTNTENGVIEVLGIQVAQAAWRVILWKTSFIAITAGILISYFGWQGITAKNEIARQTADVQDKAKDFSDQLTRTQEQMADFDRMQSQYIAAKDQLRENLINISQRYVALLDVLGSSSVVKNDPVLVEMINEQKREIESQVDMLNIVACKFGESKADHDGVATWIETLFYSDKSEGEGFAPGAGDVIIAIESINIRSGFPDHRIGEGLFFKRPTGVISKGEKIVIHEVAKYDIRGVTHWWVSFVNPLDN